MTKVSQTSIPDTFAEDLYDYLTLHVAKPLAEVTARKEVKWVRQIVKIGVKKKLSPPTRWKASNALAAT